jgi:hypothetical protein
VKGKAAAVSTGVTYALKYTIERRAPELHDTKLLLDVIEFA